MYCLRKSVLVYSDSAHSILYFCERAERKKIRNENVKFRRAHTSRTIFALILCLYYVRSGPGQGKIVENYIKFFFFPSPCIFVVVAVKIALIFTICHWKYFHISVFYIPRLCLVLFCCLSYAISACAYSLSPTTNQFHLLHSAFSFDKKIFQRAFQNAVTASRHCEMMSFRCRNEFHVRNNVYVLHTYCTAMCKHVHVPQSAT